jgi:YD repeat-containing protein
MLAYEGSKITETDARLNQTQHFLDVRGKLRRVDDQAPAGGRTEYTYDYFANLLSIKDAQNNVTSWGYDIHGFKTSVNDPDMGIWIYAYDSLGELRQVRDAKTSAELVNTNHVRSTFSTADTCRIRRD